MRTLIFVLTLLTTSAVLAGSISREIRRISSAAPSLLLDGECVLYRISASSEDAAKTIARLSHRDTLQGEGVVDEESCTVSITSIEYVGLYKLLGLWHYAGRGLRRVGGLLITTVVLEYGKMTMKIFDSDTGALVKNFELTRYNSLSR